MKKKLYLILSILIIISLLSSAAICNLGQAQSSEEAKNQAVEEGNQKKEVEKDNKTGSNDSQSANQSNNNPIINGIIISDLNGLETGYSNEEWLVEHSVQFYLTGDVSDPDNDPLTYKWSADGGSFDNTSAPKVVWTAPEFPETYKIYLEINDERGGIASFSKELIVVDTSDVKSGSPPQINDIVINDSPLYCDKTYEVEVIASDPDNDIDFYSLIPSDGTLLNQRVNVMDWITPVDPGNYTITVKVVDKAGNENTLAKSFDVISQFEIVEHNLEVTDISISTSPIYINGKYMIQATINDPHNEVERCVFRARYGVLSDQSANTIFWTTPNTPGLYPITLYLYGTDPNLVLVEEIALFDVVENK